MADERNVITILVQAIDRATGTFRTTTEKIRELEAAEKKAALAADKLDASQKRVRRTKEEHASATDRLVAASRREIEQDRRSVEIKERIQRALLGSEDAAKDYKTQLAQLRRETEGYTEATEDLENAQLSFFDRVRANNKLLGEQGRLLRDLAGADIPVPLRGEGIDAFNRRFGQRGFGVDRDFGVDRPFIGPRLRGGGFFSSEGADPNQLSLFADALSRVDRESASTERALSRLDRVAIRLGRTLGESTARFRRLSIAQRESGKSLADFTRFDETLELGLRRVLRLIATLAPLLPFLAVGVGLFLGSITALAGGVTALVGALGSLAGVLATLPGLFAATAGAALAFNAVVGPSITNITERFKEILQLEDQARKQTTENLNAQRDAAEALADIRAQNAEQLAAIDDRIREQRRNGAEEVADQERDLARLKVRNAESEADLVRELRRARRDAAEEGIENEREYQELLKSNREDERGLAAELSARRAQLGALIQQGADATEIAAAQAGVARAEQELTTQAAENRRQENAARRQNQNETRDNAERIADLERRLFRERRNNRQEEVDAERELGRTRRDNAEALVDLERQRQQIIAQGLRQERDAVQRLAETRRKASADVEDSLAGLTPSERRIVQQLRRIREEWLRLTASVRESGLAVGSRALNFFESRLPQIANRISGIASAVIAVADQALTRFTSPDRWARLDRILVDTRQNTLILGDAAIEVADAFLTIADAARPLTRFVTETVRELAEGFRESVEASERSGGLEQFFQRTQRVLDLVIDSLGNLGDALLDVMEIGAPFGEALLGDFVEWTERISDWTSSANGKRAIQDFFEDAVPVFKALAELASEFVESMFRVGRALIRPDIKTGVSLLQTIIEDLTDALPRLEDFLIRSTLENGPVLIDFLREFGQIIGLLVGPGGALVVLLDVVTDVLRLFDVLPEPVERLIITYLALNGLLIRVGRGLRAIAIALGGALFGARTAAGRGGLMAALFGPPGVAKLLIITMLIFPQLVNDIGDALQRLDDFLSPVTDQIRALGQAMGIAGDDAENFAIQLGFLFLVLRRSGIIAIITALGRMAGLLRTFIGLVRTGMLGFTVVAVLRTFRSFRFLEDVLTRILPLLRRIGAVRLFGTFGLTVAGVELYRRLDEILPRIEGRLRQIGQFIPFANLIIGARDFISRLGAIGQAVDDLIHLRFRDLAENIARLVLGTFNPLTWIELGRRIVEGIWQGIRENLPGLRDLLGAFIGRLLPNIDVPGFSPVDEAAAKAIGEPIAAGIAIGAERGMPRAFGRIGAAVAQGIQSVQTAISARSPTIFVGLAEGVENTLTRLGGAFESFGARVQSIFDGIQSVQFSLPSFLTAQANLAPVPARRELARIDRQEVLRARAEQRRTANEEVEQARRQVRIRETTLAAAERRLTALRARLSRQPISAALARRLGEPGLAGTGALTPEQRRATREAIQRQEQVIKDRRQELRDAEATVREVSARRRETFRLVALEERRERLEALAVTQEAERQKEIEEASRRASAAVESFLTALEKGKVPLDQAARRLVEILFDFGIPREQSRAWISGKKAGQDYGSGLIAALNDFGKNFEVKGGALTIKAPEVIVIARRVRAVRSVDANLKPGTFSGDRHRAAGGPVYGREGAAVPIMAHAGEWVVNRSQQWQMALMAGIDRTALQRALFHKLSPRMDFRYAMGGAVPALNGGATIGGTTFLTPINIETASPTVDIEYVSRALQSRISAVVS